MTPKLLGNRLRDIRTDLSLNQTDAAKCAGITQPALSRIETAARGEWPKIETLISLAGVYKITFLDLFRD